MSDSPDVDPEEKMKNLEEEFARAETKEERRKISEKMQKLEYEYRQGCK